MITEETKEVIQGFLPAPDASLRFLKKEMGLALIQNLVVSGVFVYLVTTYSFDVYMCAPLSMLWLTSQFIFNFFAVI